MGADFRDQAQALADQYYPIEISTELTAAQKIPLIVDWWNRSHALMIAKRLHRDDLPVIATTAKMAFRDGVPALLRLAHQRHIPVHVFSAGLYDVIHAFFTAHGLMTRDPDHPHIVANMMEFDADGFLAGFRGTLIHSFNKNSAVLRGSPGWAVIASRKAVLLLGDNQTDINMVAGYDADVVISVGFLNDRVADRLDAYAQTFDIVVLNDGPMDRVVDLLRDLLAQDPAVPAEGEGTAEKEEGSGSGHPDNAEPPAKQQQQQAA